MLKNWFVSHEIDDHYLKYTLSKGIIIGAGNVGIACAAALVLGNVFHELVIQDINMDKAEGEAMDLMHGTSQIAPMEIKAGSIDKEGKNADIVIITAGAAQKPGESRLELVEKNTAIFKTFVKDIARYCPNAIVLVVTNPVDIMSYVTYKLSGLPNSRVFGSGTVLDTSRFRSVLAEKLDLDPGSIHAYIVGEHGDSEFPLWSKMNLAGRLLVEEAKVLEEDIYQVYEQTKYAAYNIIEKKGYTNWGIGMATLRIVKAVMENKKQILPVSTYVKGMYNLPDIFLSLPTIVDRKGADKIINIKLTSYEHMKLQASAEILRSIIDKLDL